MQGKKVWAATAAIGVVFGLAIVARVGAQAPVPSAPAGGADQPAGRGRGAQAPGGRGGGGGGRATFPAQQRPPGDPVVIARGRSLYSVNCTACHGGDLRGGQLGGPNLLRSGTVLNDDLATLLLPIIQGARADKGMPAIPLSPDDVVAVATYLHSVVATSRGQGAPPPGPPVVLNILVGDPAAGAAYFATKCSACHSATGDLAGIGTRVSDAKALQNLWVAGGTGRGGASPARTVTVTVTPTGGQAIEGRLVKVDDFLVTLALSDGTIRSFRRDGETPKVDIHDPMSGHRDLLTVYTNKAMHDVTAYLVTLK